MFRMFDVNHIKKKSGEQENFRLEKIYIWVRPVVLWVANVIYSKCSFEVENEGLLQYLTTKVSIVGPLFHLGLLRKRRQVKSSTLLH